MFCDYYHWVVHYEITFWNHAQWLKTMFLLLDPNMEKLIPLPLWSWAVRKNLPLVHDNKKERHFCSFCRLFYLGNVKFCVWLSFWNACGYLGAAEMTSLSCLYNFQLIIPKRFGFERHNILHAVDFVLCSKVGTYCGISQRLNCTGRKFLPSYFILTCWTFILSRMMEGILWGKLSQGQVLETGINEDKQFLLNFIKFGLHYGGAICFYTISNPITMFYNSHTSWKNKPKQNIA